MNRAIKGLIEAGVTTDRAIRDLHHLLLSSRLPDRQFIRDTNGKDPKEYLKKPTEKGEHWRFKDNGERALSEKTFKRVKEPFKNLESLGILSKDKVHGHNRYEVNPAWIPLIKAYLEFSKKPARK
ncbi:MAG: hypothetical protein V1811_02575 [Candidatus Micrarchaeota archaeon]